MSIFHHNTLHDSDRSPLRPPRRILTLRVLGILIVPILVGSGGCSKEEITAAIEKGKEKATETVDQAMQEVEERLPENGSIALVTSPAVEKAGKADVELISFGDGRDNVVQIMTYDPSVSTRSYPAILLHGRTKATSAAALSGDTVECDMYFQASSSSPIAITRPNESVSVTFGALNTEDNALAATFNEAKLLASNDKPVNISRGDIVAVIRGEEN